MSTLARRALITGASRGIGRATALRFAKAGIEPILIGRSLSALESVQQAVLACGVNAYAYDVDLSAIQEVRAEIEKILAEVGTVEILINNAGMGYTAMLAETPLADWQAVLDLNLTSPLQCIQAVLPQMRSQQRGTILNVISIAGRQTFPEWGAYSASKFGLMSVTKTLAQEERSHGIRVVALCPGSVNTPLWDSPGVHADFDRSQMLTAEDVAETIVQAVLMPHHAVIEELTLMPNVGTF
jgi:short-subunit dehydrogenase